MRKYTDKQLMTFIQDNEAWLTYASAEAGGGHGWRCYVSERHFASPDIRERCGRVGFGKTAREATMACIQDRSGNQLCDAFGGRFEDIFPAKK